MNSSPLTILLFATGLPAIGYDYSSHTVAEREAMVAHIFATPGIAVTEGPSIRFVEVPAENTAWLVTEPGHFAHPSLLERALVTDNGARAVRVTGYTAAPLALMAQWMEQFRTQDEATRGSALC
jgi:hypothetical protein